MILLYCVKSEVLIMTKKKKIIIGGICGVLYDCLSDATKMESHSSCVVLSRCGVFYFWI